MSVKQLKLGYANLIAMSFRDLWAKVMSRNVMVYTVLDQVVLLRLYIIMVTLSQIDHVLKLHGR